MRSFNRSVNFYPSEICPMELQTFLLQDICFLSDREPGAAPHSTHDVFPNLHDGLVPILRLAVGKSLYNIFISLSGVDPGFPVGGTLAS